MVHPLIKGRHLESITDGLLKGLPRRLISLFDLDQVPVVRLFARILHWQRLETILITRVDQGYYISVLRMDHTWRCNRLWFCQSWSRVVKDRRRGLQCDDWGLCLSLLWSSGVQLNNFDFSWSWFYFVVSHRANCPTPLLIANRWSGWASTGDAASLLRIWWPAHYAFEVTTWARLSIHRLIVCCIKVTTLHRQRWTSYSKYWNTFFPFL